MFFISTIHHGTQVLKIRIAQAVTRILISSGDVDAVILAGSSPSEHFLLPVYPSLRIVLLNFPERAIHILKTCDSFFSIQIQVPLIIQCHKLFGGKHRKLTGNLGKTNIRVKADRQPGIFLPSVLRSNHHDSISSTGTIDGRRRSILQNINGFNLTWIQLCHSIFTRETINDIQRFITLGNGDTTTHTDGNGGTGTSF